MLGSNRFHVLIRLVGLGLGAGLCLPLVHAAAPSPAPQAAPASPAAAAAASRAPASPVVPPAPKELLVPTVVPQLAAGNLRIGDPSSVAAWAGGAVVVWARYDESTGKSDLLALRLDPLGSPVGKPLLLRHTSDKVNTVAVAVHGADLWLAWSTDKFTAVLRATVDLKLVSAPISSFVPSESALDSIDLLALPEGALLASMDPLCRARVYRIASSGVVSKDEYYAGMGECRLYGITNLGTLDAPSRRSTTCTRANKSTSGTSAAKCAPGSGTSSTS